MSDRKEQEGYKDRKYYLDKKKKLEETGCLPNYDYPDPGDSPVRRSPITVLNDNPGPGNYSPINFRGNRSLAFSFTSTKIPPSNQVMFVDKHESNEKDKETSKSRQMTHLPIDTVSGWKEKTNRGKSVYQTTHNAQARSTNKIKPERRGKLKSWNYYAYDHNDGSKYSLQSRNRHEYIIQSSTPGPNAHDVSTIRCTKPRAPEFTMSGRHRNILGGEQLQNTNAGVVAHI